MDSLSAVPCRLRFFNLSATGSAFATGFVVATDDESKFLVTNWHNVSGKDSITGDFLNAMMPSHLEVTFRGGSRQINDLVTRTISLFTDHEQTEPAWLEHSVHGNDVDVVLLPLPEALVEGLTILPINRQGLDQQFLPRVADDVFVLGYPFREPPPFSLAIWKKGSIASEPRAAVGGLPKFYIDTATRPGLSGSPVVMQRVGIHGKDGDKLRGDEIIGRIRAFIGIYSGRIGSEQMAQLGVVWHASVLAEISHNGRQGSLFKR